MMIDRLPIIPKLEKVVPHHLREIAPWPFTDDNEWPNIVVAPYKRPSIDMILLKIVVPLPAPLYAHRVEELAPIMIKLGTNELDPFGCAGRLWHIGDGDDTQAAWLANGSLNVLLRSWPDEQAS